MTAAMTQFPWIVALVALVWSAQALTYTGRTATVDFTPYPGTTYEVAGALKLREYTLGNLVGLHIVGNYTILGEPSGIKNASVNIHVGKDPTDASTVGNHYWEPTTAEDPWNDPTSKFAMKADAAVVDLKTTDLTPACNFSLSNTTSSVGGRVMVAHAVNSSRAGAGQIRLLTV